MSMSLRRTINQLASEFAAGILGAIRGASLQEILAETGGPRGAGRARLGDDSAVAGAFGRGHRGRRGRLERRSAKDIAGLVDRIVTLLSSKPKGMRAEQIREELGLEAKELPRPIAEALSSRKISKIGQKRATTYFAKGHGAGASGRSSAAKGRGGKRAGKKASPKRGAARKAAGKKRKATGSASAANGAPVSSTSAG